MQIQFPRRIQLGFRPWYGLTIRQLVYLAVAGIAAGAIVLFGPSGGNELLVRVIVGIGIISIGVGLAFFRKDGLGAEQWVVAQIRYRLRPQKRFWTRGGEARRDQVAEMLIDQPYPDGSLGTAEGHVDEADLSPVRLLHPTAEVAGASPTVILVDLAMLLSLFSLVVYLMRGGFGEIQGWFFTQAGR
jgi:PrgI family protein